MRHLFFSYCILLLGFTASMQAQILDAFANQSYQFNNYVKDLGVDQPYIKEKVEFTQHSFEENTNPMHKKINQGVFKLCAGYLENELRFLSLIQEANARVKVYNEIKNSQNHYRYESFKESTNPQLTSIECEIKSVVAKRVFYELNFWFEFENEDNYSNKNRLKVSHYYIADLLTGKIKKWKPALTTNKKALEKLTEPQLRATYLMVTNKLNLKQLADDDQDDENNNETDVTKTNNESVAIFTKIDLKDADFYWFSWGLLIQFQEYTPSTKIYGGKSFHLFLPYEEALKITALFPEFDFMKNLPRLQHGFTNWNNWDFAQQKVSILRTEPTVLEVVKQNGSKKPIKTLQQTFYQINEDLSRRLTGKTISEFSFDQKLLSSRSFDENDKMVHSAFNDYDTKGNIKLTTVKDNYEKESSVSYTYDAKNNLKTRRTINATEIETFHFFYNKNFVYFFNDNMFESDRNRYIFRYEIKEKAFCSDNACYQLNAKGDVIGINDKKYVSNQGQIARDKMGRLTETHFENDRYNYYFEYDANNRFKRFQIFEYQKINKEAIFQYNENELLPNLLKRKTTQYNVVQEEEYVWDFFKP